MNKLIQPIQTYLQRYNGDYGAVLWLMGDVIEVILLLAMLWVGKIIIFDD